MATSKTTRSTNQRALILDSAIEVVDAEGAGHLTIDRVAARAGVSKGGVLYHFPNKRALLTGLLERLIEREFSSQEAAPGDSALERHLHSARNLKGADKAASLALLAAAAEDPDLLDIARDAYKALFEQARQTASDRVEANSLMVAAEGLRLLSVLGLSPLSQAEERAVHEHLAKRAASL